MDLLVTGIKARFNQSEDKTLLAMGSIDKLRAWDPDMSKVTSDRNRHLLDLSEEPGMETISDPFFSFQYMTFKGPTDANINVCVSIPEWVQNKISSGDIDDFLSVKMRPLEFNYLSERTAELADYLNNGLPGEYSPYIWRNLFTIFFSLPRHIGIHIIMKEREWVQHQKLRRTSAREESELAASLIWS